MAHAPPEFVNNWPTALTHGNAFQNQSNPPCGVNSSFTYPAFNATGSPDIPVTDYYTGGMTYFVVIDEVDWNFNAPEFSFYLLYRATLDPAAQENWTDLVPMVKVDSETEQAELDWSQVTVPTEWAGLFGVAQSVMVTDEYPPRYTFQCAVLQFFSEFQDGNPGQANGSNLTIFPVDYDASLIPVGKAGFIWPPNITEPSPTPTPAAPSPTAHSKGVTSGPPVGYIALVALALSGVLWLS